jgi:hypothetical protein
LKGTVESKEFLDAVKEISPHHGDFINDDCVELFVDRAFPGRPRADFIQGDTRPEAKKRVNRLPLNIDCGDAGWSQHDEFFRGRLAEMLEQGRFTCPGSPGEKEMRRGLFQTVENMLALGVKRQ